MKNNQPGSIENHFSNITDPRELNKRHKFIDIITIAICAVVCGVVSEQISMAVNGLFKLSHFASSGLSQIPFYFEVHSLSSLLLCL